MGQIIYVEGGLYCPLDHKDAEAILSIKDGWGESAFDYHKGTIFFQNNAMEGCEPFVDGVEKPLEELLAYAKDHDLDIDGDIEVSGDVYGENEKHITIRIENSERHDKTTEIVNASTDELVEELKQRGVLPEDFEYDDDDYER